jgi:hypothetical protein
MGTGNTPEELRIIREKEIVDLNAMITATRNALKRKLPIEVVQTYHRDIAEQKLRVAKLELQLEKAKRTPKPTPNIIPRNKRRGRR